MDIVFVALALVWCHFLGDFAAQTNNMATLKSESTKWLALHVLAYSVFLLPFGLVYTLVNAVLHFLTDEITSRHSRRYREAGNLRAFFVLLGGDQAFHLTCLLMTMPLMSPFVPSLQIW